LTRTTETAVGCVIALLADAAPALRLRDALKGDAVVHVAATIADAHHLLKTVATPLAAVIVEPHDREGRPTAGFVRQVAAAHPGVPLVGYCCATLAESREIVDLVSAGVHDLLFKGVHDVRIAARHVLHAASLSCAADQIFAQIADVVPERLESLVRHALREPQAAHSVSAVADVLGLHRKTLANYCADAALPPPGELIAWCRLFLTAYLLGTTARTVERIALELDFASDTALRNMMKRYTGHSASEVRRHGGLPCAVDAFRKHLVYRRTPQLLVG
jgi:AraC-like DNA-binding protein